MGKDKKRRSRSRSGDSRDRENSELRKRIQRLEELICERLPPPPPPASPSCPLLPASEYSLSSDEEQITVNAGETNSA